MPTETRSRKGCWTCRLRRKKCDETHPQCKQCLTAGLDCHGFGQKPAWMDGDVREKAELATIRLKIEMILLPLKLSLLNLTTLSSLISTTTKMVRFANYKLFEMDVDVKPIGTPRSVHLLSDCSFQDSHLLLHFIEEVHTWVFRFRSSHQFKFDRSGLLWLIIRHRPLYHIALALSAAHIHAYKIPKGITISQEDLMYKYDLAMQELRSCLQQYTCAIRTNAKPDHVLILLYIVMIMFLNVIHSQGQGWRVHLQAALSVIEPLVLHHSQGYSQCSHENSIGLTVTLSSEITSSWEYEMADLLMGLVIWFDILSNICLNASPSLCTSPSLCNLYIKFLESPNLGINLDKATGCQDWVIVSMLSIYSFRDWKIAARTEGSLSIWELTRKATNIRQRLEEGIAGISQQRLEHESQLRDQTMNGISMAKSRYEILTITQVFASAALVFLEATVSGPYPSLIEVEREVDQAIDVLKDLPDPTLLQYLGWPLCVIGCMAQPKHYGLLQSLFSIVDNIDEVILSDITRLVQRCWTLRENYQDGNGVDWNDAMQNLGRDLLFI
ncbi:fungal-specific transcription factor domain-containing protein [Xylogone sp. PMI_703]|nr:fungal-specific transcription factor domain-containing protein [Xylogone sp. PMI_703]